MLAAISRYLRCNSRSFRSSPEVSGGLSDNVTPNSFDVLLDIPELLSEEDSQRFLGVCAHIPLHLFAFLHYPFRHLPKDSVVNFVREIHRLFYRVRCGDELVRSLAFVLQAVYRQ